MSAEIGLALSGGYRAMLFHVGALLTVLSGSVLLIPSGTSSTSTSGQSPQPGVVVQRV